MQSSPSSDNLNRRGRTREMKELRPSPVNTEGKEEHTNTSKTNGTSILVARGTKQQQQRQLFQTIFLSVWSRIFGDRLFFYNPGPRLRSSFF